MAYLDDSAVVALASGGPADLLVSHQGPASVHGEYSSETLDRLLSRPAARVWCHRHGGRTLEPTAAGVEGRCLVVPLGDVAFSGRGGNAGPGLEGWCLLTLAGGGVTLERALPSFWREYRRKLWRRARGGSLVCPDPLRFVDRRDLSEE